MHSVSDSGITVICKSCPRPQPQPTLSVLQSHPLTFISMNDHHSNEYINPSTQLHVRSNTRMKNFAFKMKCQRRNNVEMTFTISLMHLHSTRKQISLNTNWSIINAIVLFNIKKRNSCEIIVVSAVLWIPLKSSLIFHVETSAAMPTSDWRIGEQ